MFIDETAPWLPANTPICQHTHHWDQMARHLGPHALAQGHPVDEANHHVWGTIASSAGWGERYGKVVKVGLHSIC